MLKPAGLLVVLLLAAAPAHAAEYYVATTGDDGNAGTMAAPFASVERAQMAAAAGDTVFIRGGVYSFSGTSATIGVALTKSGQPDKPIHYFAFAGERPIFDLFELTPQARVTGIDVQCSFIHLRGLEIRGVRQLIVGDSWSVRVRGDHNVLEQLDVHDGQAPGIFITSGAENLVLDCDSHHNYDPLEDGGNGDGFGCHSSGGGNVLRGCRAYSNSDDGFDFINAAGTCTVEQSWSFHNGYVPDTMMGAGNGAGFKAGGFGSPPKIPTTGVPRHVIRQNVAFGNRSQGFYANHHPGGLDFLNNTAFDNPTNFDMLVEGAASTHELHNNVALAPGNAVARFTGGSDSSNAWTLSIDVSSDDFASTDVAEALLPRAADGSLPDVSFMHLASGSQLIDRGEDVGLAFNDAAPDLGAFESGPPLSGGDTDAGVPDPGSGSAGSAGGAGASGAGSAGTSGAGGSGGATAVTPGSGAGAGASGMAAAGGGQSMSAGSAAASGSTSPDAAQTTDRKANDSSSGCSAAAHAPDTTLPVAPALFAVALLFRRRRALTRASSSP